jgi:predicted acyl esterase
LAPRHYSLDNGLQRIDAAEPVITEHFILDRDVVVPMRDGARLKADVFRPKEGGRVPALLNFGPYQKGKPWFAANQQRRG